MISRPRSFPIGPSVARFGMALVAVAFPSFLLAQATEATPLYSAAQAEEGKTVFEQSCARCHGPELAGKDDAPPLTGSYFASSWGGHQVSELLAFVQGNMPFETPGALDEASYLRVVAYVLSRNGIPAGTTPLAKGSAGVITVPKD